MFYAVEYKIGFELPKEYEQMEKFIQENDLSKWKRIETSRCVYFVTKESRRLGVDDEN